MVAGLAPSRSARGDVRLLARLHQLDAIFTIFGGSDRDKCLILQR